MENVNEFLTFLVLFYVYSGYSCLQLDENSLTQQNYHLPKSQLQRKENNDSIYWRKILADKNLEFQNKHAGAVTLFGDGEVITYNPKDPAPDFALYTLNGKYVYSQATRNHSIIIHVFDTNSAFLECLWSSDDALKPILHPEYFNNTEIIFISKSAHYDEEYGALWMKNRLDTLYRKE